MSTGLARAQPRLGRGPAALLLAAALAVLLPLHLARGLEQDYPFGPGEISRGLGALIGAGEGLAADAQIVLELRVWRSLVAAGVGALLAVAGALLQGLFRNGLASPALIGVTAGANLGATLAMLALGGYGALLAIEGAWSASPYFLTGAALVGALAVSAIVVAVASSGPRVSVATLLLVGVAINTCIAGGMSAIQQVLLSAQDWDTAAQIQNWTFGQLDDRKSYHVALVCLGLLATGAALPFVSTELDLLAGGDDDAASLGVPVRRVRALVLLVAAFATACAVAAAGQVGFVGLVVPHIVRMGFGAGHRAVLPLSMLGGAVFLLACDLAQFAVLGGRPLRPGVLMSLIGGPFFLLLLIRNRRSLAW